MASLHILVQHQNILLAHFCPQVCCSLHRRIFTMHRVHHQQGWKYWESLPSHRHPFQVLHLFGCLWPGAGILLLIFCVCRFTLLICLHTNGWLLNISYKQNAQNYKLAFPQILLSENILKGTRNDFDGHILMQQICIGSHFEYLSQT